MASEPTVAMISLWQNDATWGLHARALHLLSKPVPGVGLRWIWVVGDSDDNTEDELMAIAARHPERNIQIVRHDTGIEGEEPKVRLLRISLTADAALDAIAPTDDYIILHESDLRSPRDLVRRFLDTGKECVAGWVTLGEDGIFYDTFAYRKDGTCFTNYPPYHVCYQADQIFEVDSFGACWMAPAVDFREGVRCKEWGVVGICEQLKARGRRLWVDPTITVVQPTEYWIPRQHA